jgi:hypothetical protein
MVWRTAASEVVFPYYKERQLASKQEVSPPDAGDSEHRGRFWEPPEKRGVVSDEGRKWLEENAEAAAEWNEWVKKNGVPLPPQF